MPPFLDLNALLPLVANFSMICTRIAFMFISAPVMSATSVPRRVVAVAVFLISVTVYLGMPAAPAPELNLIGIVTRLFGEAAVGAAAGLAARIVFAAVESAGQVLGVPMGLGFSQAVDPLTNSQTTVTSRLLGLIMSMVFFAMDIHLVLIRATIESFVILPPGQVPLNPEAGMLLVRKGAVMFNAAVQLAAPVLVVLMGVMVSLGMLAKVAPKVNLFTLSFAVSIAVGVIALRAAVPNIVAYTRGLALRIEPIVVQVITGF